MPDDDTPAGRTRREDGAADRRTLWVTAGAIGGLFAVGAVAQATYIFAAFVPSWRYVSVGARVGVNTIAVVVLLGTLTAWGQPRRTRPRDLVVGALLAGLPAAGVRVVLQVAFGIYPDFAARTSWVELISGSLMATSSAALGTWVMVSRRRLREQVREAAISALAAELAVRALEDEEIRVRREVADGLHSSMQQRLVLVTGRLDGVLARLAAAGITPQELAPLQDARDEVEDVREQDVRQISRLLYPDQLEIGLVPAVRALLRRVPPAIATRLHVDDALRALDDPAAPELSQAERLLAVRVVEEALSNALRHAAPTLVEVGLGLDHDGIALSVRDDGGGFDPATVIRSGTRRLAERLSIVGGTLEVDGVPGEGTRVTARLPVDALRPR